MPAFLLQDFRHQQFPLRGADSRIQRLRFSVQYLKTKASDSGDTVFETTTGESKCSNLAEFMFGKWCGWPCIRHDGCCYGGAERTQRSGQKQRKLSGKLLATLTEKRLCRLAQRFQDQRRVRAAACFAFETYPDRQQTCALPKAQKFGRGAEIGTNPVKSFGLDLRQQVLHKPTAKTSILQGRVYCNAHDSSTAQ